ncbi:hypothetical protein Mucpa_1302 [Mucilaginibacter paludis DSM 18603]|uniref:Uncharacterized protein n=1 Tax=Mucilaginibacter paludis DSM 18603 TaxID=714943 RepID=H1YHD0_9SPHI|nr:hypothetical protein Mucpa_1302 [Mucilaginibacter paludis DSM 18603]
MFAYNKTSKSFATTVPLANTLHPTSSPLIINSDSHEKPKDNNRPETPKIQWHIVAENQTHPPGTAPENPAAIKNFRATGKVPTH